jgi:hypothetical protein
MTGNYLCNAFRNALMAGLADIQGGDFRIALYDAGASLDASTGVYPPDGEIVAAGYTAGGQLLTPVFGGGWINFENVSWTGVMTARGALIYLDAGPAVCVLDFGADKTSAVTLTVQFPPATSTTALLRLN